MAGPLVPSATSLAHTPHSHSPSRFSLPLTPPFLSALSLSFLPFRSAFSPSSLLPLRSQLCSPSLCAPRPLCLSVCAPHSSLFCCAVFCLLSLFLSFARSSHRRAAWPASCQLVFPPSSAPAPAVCQPPALADPSAASLYRCLRASATTSSAISMSPSGPSQVHPVCRALLGNASSRLRSSPCPQTRERASLLARLRAGTSAQLRASSSLS